MCRFGGKRERESEKKWMEKRRRAVVTFQVHQWLNKFQCTAALAYTYSHPHMRFCLLLTMRMLAVKTPLSLRFDHKCTLGMVAAIAVFVSTCLCTHVAIKSWENMVTISKTPTTTTSTNGNSNDKIWREKKRRTERWNERRKGTQMRQIRAIRSGNCTFIYCLYEICPVTHTSKLVFFPLHLANFLDHQSWFGNSYIVHTFNDVRTFFDFEQLPIMLSSQKQNITTNVVKFTVKMYCIAWFFFSH